ncbi:MAG TPA: carboxypeptidase M32 [Anaerolineales bacterium]|nr:carboxypeptidase M32 [Anaerolineales bacterium]
MEEKLNELKFRMAEIADLNFTAQVLGWDQQTYMPPGGAEARGHQLATVSSLSHIKFTSDEVGRLLEDLEPVAETLDPDSNDARLIEVTAREYKKAVKIPSALVAELARVSTVAQQVWEAARENNDFPSFQPHLQKLVDLRRQYAELFAPYDHVYDPLLDDFEPGLKTAEVQAIFGELRRQQVALIQAIADKPPVDDSFLHLEFDEQKQWDFGVEVITRFGYDWKRGRQDRSVHPFTTNFGIDDVRITTRIHRDFLNTAIFGSMHETGHALYELGVDHALARTPLASGASLALHESQSRMWENLVGRSLPFWEYFYPRLQETFPSQLGNVDLHTFYKGINKVEPSLIRVEADEATYNLHIMLRLELEIALMEGRLAVADLPEAWNDRMENYLGIRPPNDSVGVLQDVHWSGGGFGYFPTYALGNLVSVQLWECINRDIPDLEDKIRKGEFGDLLAWLRRNIHQHGAKFKPQELVKKVTGSKIDPAPYMNYLQDKFGAIYDL